MSALGGADAGIERHSHRHRIGQTEAWVTALLTGGAHDDTVAVENEPGQIIFESTNRFEIVFEQVRSAARQFPAHHFDRQAGTEDDAGGLRIHPSVVLGSRRDVARRASGAAHDDRPAHVTHEAGIALLFRAPEDKDGTPVCQGCPQRKACYRGDSGARQVSIAFARLPWLDPEFPQLSKRFHKIMAKRTSIERLHKLMKYDYGDERLTKRGNAAFQARLDKTLLIMHLVLAHE